MIGKVLMRPVFYRRQYIYLGGPPIRLRFPPSVRQLCLTESCCPLDSNFKVIEVSPTTMTVDEDKIRNTISINGAALASWHWRNWQSDNSYTRQMNQSPIRTTESTDVEDQLPQKNSLTCRASKSITLGVILAKAILFDTPCTGTATH